MIERQMVCELGIPGPRVQSVVLALCLCHLIEIQYVRMCIEMACSQCDGDRCHLGF